MKVEAASRSQNQQQTEKGYMTDDSKDKPSRVPVDSKFYHRVLPVLLVSMAVVMFVLIVVALGVLLGFTPYR